MTKKGRPLVLSRQFFTCGQAAHSQQLGMKGRRGGAVLLPVSPPPAVTSHSLSFHPMEAGVDDSGGRG